MSAQRQTIGRTYSPQTLQLINNIQQACVYAGFVASGAMGKLAKETCYFYKGARVPIEILKS